MFRGGRAGSAGVGASSSESSGVYCGGVSASGEAVTALRWFKIPAMAAAGPLARGDSGSRGAS